MRHQFRFGIFAFRPKVRLYFLDFLSTDDFLFLLSKNRNFTIRSGKRDSDRLKSQSHWVTFVRCSNLSLTSWVSSATSGTVSPILPAAACNKKFISVRPALLDPKFASKQLWVMIRLGVPYWVPANVICIKWWYWVTGNWLSLTV